MTFDFESHKHIATVGLMDGAPFIGAIDKAAVAEELAAMGDHNTSDDALAIRQAIVTKIRDNGVAIRVPNPNDARAVIALLNMLVGMMSAMVEALEEGAEDESRGAMH